jgi:signal transduction histidine kinase
VQNSSAVFSRTLALAWSWSRPKAVNHTFCQYQVQMRNASSELHLAIADSGVGFDPASATNRQGPGLVSMQERAKLADGTVAIARPFTRMCRLAQKKIRKVSTRHAPSEAACI